MTNDGVVQAALECASRADWDGFSSFVDADVVWTPVRGDPDFAIHRGMDAVRAWGAAWTESFPEMRWEPRALTEAGDDRVVAVVRLVGRGGASGAEVDHTYATVFTVRAGRIVAVDEHRTVRGALEAAGLPHDAASLDAMAAGEGMQL
jgi:ketosteroid isomerase-like protein